MGGAMNASLETTLAIELFLNDNYLFRHNVLNGKVEFAVKSADSDPDFRPLTQEALNSIIRRAKKEQVCEKGSPKTEIMEFVHSEDVPATIWRVCPNGTDRTISPSSSIVCLVSLLSSRGF